MITYSEFDKELAFHFSKFCSNPKVGTYIFRRNKSKKQRDQMLGQLRNMIQLSGMFKMQDVITDNYYRLRFIDRNPFNRDGYLNQQIINNGTVKANKISGRGIHAATIDDLERTTLQPSTPHLLPSDPG